MTIDYFSDPHFETHLAFSPQSLKERFDIRFAPAFEAKKSDTLVIAGDIGEYNDINIQALRLLRDGIGYKNILLVLGNHDLFLPNRKAIEGYGSSIKRVEEMKELCGKEHGFHLLDGSIVEVDGVRIGGAMGWYDTKYIFHNLNPYYSKDRDYINRLGAICGMSN